MRVGIIFVYVDYHRRGRKNRVSMQPQIGPLIAGLLPRDIEIDVVNETWEDPDWSRDYDLLFLSCMHSDFDRARQISHYWRQRGAKTVFGGAFASSYPDLCQPFFDVVVIGDPEHTVPALYADFCAGELKARYRNTDYDASAVATPRFDLLAGKALHSFALEATRGCPFTCEFCVLTGVGTRHHTRPAHSVVRDITAGQRALEGKVPRHKTRVVGFCDNNLGGNLGYLRELCAALKPLRVQWYAAVTFNVISHPDLVRLMADAGCRILFVGLESFNPVALDEMGKHQNAAHKTRAAIDCCRDHGILVISGLMVSPISDGVDYIRSIPRHLAQSGLHVPTFLCFETPILGTPYFRRLAAEHEAAFLPDALLRDFTGYTLVVRPRQAETAEFVAAYREAVRDVFSARNRLRKLADDLPRLLRHGYWLPAATDLVDMVTMQAADVDAPGRTYLAGSDAAPPERVPFTDADFDSEEQRHAILEPWRVTDSEGYALDFWLRGEAVFAPRSRAGKALNAGRAR
ncbi:MAG: radical SAM protein [Burkholderiales bacterium]